MDIIAKNLLTDKNCFKCAHYAFEDGEQIDIEYCCKNNTSIPGDNTCICWEEYIDAKNVLLDRSCTSCYYNNDWEHPHNDSDVKNCSLPSHYTNRKNGVCKDWKKK